MQKYIFLIALAILMSCSNKGKLKLEGKIDNAEPKSKIFLYEQQVTESRLLDSSVLSSSGKFTFKIKTSEPRFYFLQFGKSGIINLLLSPGETPFITAKAPNIKSSIDAIGSSGTKLILELTRKHDSTLQHLDSIVAMYKRIKDQPESKDRIAVLEDDYNKSKSAERKNTIRFIIENYKSMASIMALYLMYDTAEYVLQYPRDLQYFKIVSDTLTKIYPSSRYVKALSANFNKMLNTKKSEVIRNMINHAKSHLPEIALPNAKGDTIKITSLSGKIILLSFWSYESKECFMLNKDYLKLYKKYGKSGLAIYQISIDSDKNKWLTAIKEIPWISVAEINNQNSYYARLYNISQVPACFLIDQKGSISGKNADYNELDKTISGLLKK